MNRLEILRKDISFEDCVLEIGPYFNPIAPKSGGYRTTTLDVFGTDILRTNAAVDPGIPKERVAEIEDVDLLGSASDLADLTAARYGADHRYDWILSSHNIEHLPNPVRFLRQCAQVLRPNGVLRLAVPDKRFCFDHFRPLTEISELLQAFHENRIQPTPHQIFRCRSFRSEREPHGKTWTPVRRNLALYRTWFGPDGVVPKEYIDAHCWAFRPESFELLMLDLIAFGLVDLEIDAVSDTYGLEFFVDLRRPTKPVELREEHYYAAREWLLHRCIDGSAGADTRPRSVRFVPQTPRCQNVPQRVLREIKRVVRQVKVLSRTAAA